ncbi:lysM domain receptor-like kinase 3 [Amborella trichopoda]|uniref:lysM domain receptor-like kinase 3 n=1 Tax=Amborella trichopoda TaxID=13333 RepID=UPI0005D2FDBD|nr:lysM domain receptor-like kinase 3 [Amborella trichopoda]|eukprot:XP_006847621.2 lysM domain receptor-like kinase 3 [Amborella trichopoda]
MRGPTQDYLIRANCTCQNFNGTTGYFARARFQRPENALSEILAEIFDGQVWGVKNEGTEVEFYVLCGCLEEDVVVTYTVQQSDTLVGIATPLRSDVGRIQRLNAKLVGDPNIIVVGWVLYVPMQKPGSPNKKKKRIPEIVVGISASIALLLVGLILVLFVKRRNRLCRQQPPPIKDPENVTKWPSARTISSLRNQSLGREIMEDGSGFESERPFLFTLEEIEEATEIFAETKKIGEGGYGDVYYGVLEKQEVAIKRMKSNKSKEFFAELKVLCKVHHLNVVELIGYACGDDHLYLVYEYIHNGSLSDHLHDPQLKGHEALPWDVRIQIAVDAARGIEYIHDHTKTRYVHRDIKTTNILLDEALRAKVSDFGLAKLLERTGAENFMTTRLVGTPGYLPPESVCELQSTPKSDVYAFGVVLAELITGKRALVREIGEPNKMKSLISIMLEIFRGEEPYVSLQRVTDKNLNDNYPIEEVNKMAEIAFSCLNEDPTNRPEMREVVIKLSHIVMCTLEWGASLGGNNQVFSGLIAGR